MTKMLEELSKDFVPKTPLGHIWNIILSFFALSIHLSIAVFVMKAFAQRVYMTDLDSLYLVWFWLPWVAFAVWVPIGIKLKKIKHPVLTSFAVVIWLIAWFGGLVSAVQ